MRNIRHRLQLGDHLRPAEPQADAAACDHAVRHLALAFGHALQLRHVAHLGHEVLCEVGGLVSSVTCDQSYKGSTIIFYNCRGVPQKKIAYITTLGL